uniref:Cytochrome P450 n=1 Tax=Bionectria ochroleuca TaxID=29856 RepID=A0A8H7N2X6_BIOOC
MGMFREINCALSCRTFFGDYISQDAVKNIANDYYLVTAALELVNVPLSIYVPGTKTYKGRKLAKEVQAEFARCAARCKVNMASGARPTCTVDEWVLHMMESKKYRERVEAGEKDVPKPQNLIREFSNEEIGQVLFTFLFASQDASSSATTFLFQIMAQRPDVLDKVREENLAIRGVIEAAPLSWTCLRDCHTPTLSSRSCSDTAHPSSSFLILPPRRSPSRQTTPSQRAL